MSSGLNLNRGSNSLDSASGKRNTKWDVKRPEKVWIMKLSKQIVLPIVLPPKLFIYSFNPLEAVSKNFKKLKISYNNSEYIIKFKKKPYC